MFNNVSGAVIVAAIFAALSILLLILALVNYIATPAKRKIKKKYVQPPKKHKPTRTYSVVGIVPALAVITLTWSDLGLIIAFSIIIFIVLEIAIVLGYKYIKKLHKRFISRFKKNPKNRGNLILTKAEIADYLEKTYKNDIYINRKELYEKNGLPKADVCYLHKNWRSKILGFIYEVEYEKVILLLKLNVEIVQKIRKYFPMIEKSAYPKLENGRWYSIVVDKTTFKTKKAVYLFFDFIMTNKLAAKEEVEDLSWKDTNIAEDNDVKVIETPKAVETSETK